MAIKLYNRREVVGENVGVIHLQGIDAHDSETICGHCWSGNEYEETEDKVTCPLCLRAIEQLQSLLRRAKRRKLL